MTEQSDLRWHLAGLGTSQRWGTGGRNGREHLLPSGHHGPRNPAVDTVAVGGTVTRTWANRGSTSHSVLSEGSPSFASSATMSGNGKSYSVMFATPGTYEYDCAVHGEQMTGTIVVQ